MTPPREVSTTTSVVRALVADQFPHLRRRELRRFAAGWDNDLYRLGSDLLVRMPRREVAVVNLANEHQWLPTLTRLLDGPGPTGARSRSGTARLRVPDLVGTGRPGRGYPWPWSIVAWLPGTELGTVAERAAHGLGDPADGYRRALFGPAGAALVLGEFLAALHQLAPDDAPRSPSRGVPVAVRRVLTRAHIDELRGADVVSELGIDLAVVESCWLDLAEVGDWDGPPVWLHGDLHPRNLLVLHGRLSGIIDFGDLCAGDPATDLSVAWMLFDAPERATLRRSAGNPDDRTWRRAQLWAISLALAHLAGAPHDPVHRHIAATTLGRAVSPPAA